MCTDEYVTISARNLSPAKITDSRPHKWIVFTSRSFPMPYTVYARITFTLSACLIVEKFSFDVNTIFFSVLLQIIVDISSIEMVITDIKVI